jgi:hypothetical protein
MLEKAPGSSVIFGKEGGEMLKLEKTRLSRSRTARWMEKKTEGRTKVGRVACSSRAVGEMRK